MTDCSFLRRQRWLEDFFPILYFSVFDFSGLFLVSYIGNAPDLDVGVCSSSCTGPGHRRSIHRDRAVVFTRARMILPALRCGRGKPLIQPVRWETYVVAYKQP